MCLIDCMISAAMFSAMLSGLSGSEQSMNHTRSLLDCAAQATTNQARSLGLASINNTSNSGEGHCGPALSIAMHCDIGYIAGPLSALHSMADMKTEIGRAHV